LSNPRSGTVDLDQVLREIDEEVRARRAAGDFPPDLERELDLVFARFAPAVPTGDGLDGAIDAADRAGFINVDVPTASRLPGVSFVKKSLRKLMSWYLRFLAQQVSAFSAAVVGALRLIGVRLDRLEAATPGANPVLADEARRVGPPPQTAHFEPLALQVFDGVTGRVAVIESGDGTLVRRLVEAGVDAYGVDPRVELVDAAVTSGLEVRHDEGRDHLDAVADGALAGVVLAGCVDRLATGAQLELLERAADALGDGGRIVVVGTTPAAWARSTDVIATDLSPGRPLHAETWAHLLERRGFLTVRRHDGPSLGALEPTGQAAVDANLARIEAALFGPASFAVTGTRRR
jgi:hypothetical protein